VQHDVGTRSLFVGYLFYFYCDGDVCKMNWIREHIHTIAALLAVALVVLAGIVLGGIVAFLSGFWLIASGSMDGMVISSWGY
jgi:hypothetical protein